MQCYEMVKIFLKWQIGKESYILLKQFFLEGILS